MSESTTAKLQRLKEEHLDALNAFEIAKIQVEIAEKQIDIILAQLVIAKCEAEITKITNEEADIPF